MKLKCAWEQEFVIGGYTDPAGSRADFGAVLVGYYEDGRLQYAGKVGTGFSATVLHDLGARLRRRWRRRRRRLSRVRPVPRGTHWTRPELVAQVGFCRVDQRWSAAPARASADFATTSARAKLCGSGPSEHGSRDQGRGATRGRSGAIRN